MQPALVFAPVPDPIFWAQHPPAPFAIEYRKIAHCDAERARLKVSGFALVNQVPVANLSFGEWIDRHGVRVCSAGHGRIQAALGPAACVAPLPEAHLDPALAALQRLVPSAASDPRVHACPPGRSAKSWASS